jgi:hypothetical protein
MSFGEPVYSKIEFCRDPKTLWGKIESGRWDWLGVHPEGQFVLGSPPASRITDNAAVQVDRGGAETGEHGIKVHVPRSKNARVEWFASEREAVSAFQHHVKLQEERDTPFLVRVQRIEQREVVEEQFIVRRPSTYR